MGYRTQEQLGSISVTKNALYVVLLSRVNFPIFSILKTLENQSVIFCNNTFMLQKLNRYRGENNYA